MQLGIRCYELFRDGKVAFEREGKLCFGPRSKLSAFLSGSNESFLVGEEAKVRIAELRKARRKPLSDTPPFSDDDGLATTRKRWEREQSQWAPEYVREQLEGLR